MTVVLLAQAIGLAFLAGGVLLFALTVLPASRSVAWHLWPVFGSEAGILAVGLLPWLLPHTFLPCFLLVAAARIGYESGTVYGLTSGQSLGLGYAVLLMLITLLSWFAPSVTFLWALSLASMIAIAIALFSGTKSNTARMARFTLFPLLPMAAFSNVAGHVSLAPMLVLAFFFVEMFDSFSLLGGKLYGKTPLVPRLSPRKTWEGLATGICAVTLAGLGLTTWLGVSLNAMMTATAVVVVTAIIGDFLGSLAKRQAGVKDYPPVMLVQGGLLDITDAWLVAGPCLAGLALLMGWI